MLIQIDGTFLFVVISFLIFLFIIKSILYTPFSKIIDERQNFYDKNERTKTDSKEKSKNLIKQKETLLNQSRLEASNIIKETSKEAKDKSIQRIKQAKNDVQKSTLEYSKELSEQSNSAKCEIKSEVNFLVNSIISKVLKQEVSINLDEDKINHYLYR